MWRPYQLQDHILLGSDAKRKSIYLFLSLGKLCLTGSAQVTPHLWMNHCGYGNMQRSLICRARATCLLLRCREGHLLKTQGLSGTASLIVIFYLQGGWGHTKLHTFWKDLIIWDSITLVKCALGEHLLPYPHPISALGKRERVFSQRKIEFDTKRWENA